MERVADRKSSRHLLADLAAFENDKPDDAREASEAIAKMQDHENDWGKNEASQTGPASDLNRPDAESDEIYSGVK